jgi:D-arabinose 1-dehydrogenase-like Zn-dependent alcohol dehydrogenase
MCAHHGEASTEDIMQAMVLRKTAPLAEQPEPLVFETVPDPVSGHGEVVIAVTACGVCHTEFDEIEERTPPPWREGKVPKVRWQGSPI